MAGSPEPRSGDDTYDFIDDAVTALAGRRGTWLGDDIAAMALIASLTLARKGRAFASLDSLIARQGGQHVLYGSALALAAALQAWSRHAATPLTDLARTVIR